VVPPPLRRRGAAAARATELSTMDGTPDEAGELRRRGLVRRTDLERMGTAVSTAPVAGDWHADPAHWAALRQRLSDEVSRYATVHPLEPGAPVEALRQLLHLPDRSLVAALVAPPLAMREGRVAAGPPSGLPEPIARAIDRVRADLAGHPFLAPEAGRLAELGLGPREIGAAVRAGALVRIAEGIVLAPDGVDEAVQVLAGLPQPFTLSAARQALGTTRRVAVPLLELLDRRGLTRRLPDDRRVVTGGSRTAPGAPR
jgi:selenocysteine-specific elongation factor